MASSFKTSFALLLLCLSIFSVLSHHIQGDASANIPSIKDQRVEKILKALSDAGYDAMALTLEMTLPTLTSSMNTSQLTIFSPTDKSFFSLRYPLPPLTLLKYQVSPLKLDKETLNSGSYPLGSKVDTLLKGHLLVVSTLPGEEKASFNEVKIVQWDIYNDGDVAVHGVDRFFNPAYQTLLYPRYDGAAKNNSNKISGESSEGDWKLHWWNYLLVATPFPL